MRFTFAELHEKADGYKNFKLYIREYFYRLRESEPNEPMKVHYHVVAEEFGIVYRYVQKIINDEKCARISFKKPPE